MKWGVLQNYEIRYLKMTGVYVSMKQGIVCIVWGNAAENCE